MPATLQDFRKQYPQYDDVSDQDLADSLHAKYYPDLPRDKFNADLGVSPPSENNDPGPAPKTDKEPTLGDKVGEAGRRFVSEAGGAVAKVPELLERVEQASGKHLPDFMTAPLNGGPRPTSVEQGPLFRIGKSLENELPAPNPALNDSTIAKAGGVGGNIAGLLAAYLAGGPTAAAILGGSSGGENAAREAAALKATPEQQNTAAFANAPVDAALSVLPVGRMAGRLGSEAARSVLDATVKSGVENAAAGGAGQAASNVIAQNTYDPSRPTLQNVPEAAAVSGIAGGVVGGAARGVVNLRGTPTPEVVPEAQPEPPPAALPPPSIENRPPLVEAEGPVSEAQRAEQHAAAANAAKENVQVAKTADAGDFQPARDASGKVLTKDDGTPLFEPKPAPAPDRMRAAEDQAALTPDNVASQRDAETAFRLAEAQRRTGVRPDDEAAAVPLQSDVDAKARNDAEAQRAFDEADVQRRRGEEYQANRAEKETAFQQGQDSGAIAARIGEDPAKLVQEHLAIPPEQFHTLPMDAKERLVAAAQKVRGETTAQAPPLRSSDDSAALSEGAAPDEIGQHSPAAKPEPGKPGFQQPTDTENVTSGKPYSRTSAGGSERPFNAESSAAPEHDAMFEAKADEQAKAAKQASVDDLMRQWQERAHAKEKSGAAPDADAQKKYQGAQFSNAAEKQHETNGFPVDEFGFVKSTKGGPVRFADQRQAANWAVNVGNKTSKSGQYFEIANHPSGKGFTVRERGRAEAEAPKAEPEAAQPAQPTRELPKPQGEESHVVPPENTPRQEVPEGERSPDQQEHAGPGGRPERQGSGRPSDGREDGGPDEQQRRGQEGRQEESPTQVDEGSRVTEPEAERGKPEAGVESGDANGRLLNDDPEKAADEAPKKGEQGTFNFGSTLYSNPLADPRVWAGIGKMLSSAAKWTAEEAKVWTSTLRRQAEALKSSTALTDVKRALSYIYGATVGSKEGELWSIYRRTGAEGYRQLHEWFASDPTGKRSVGETFAEARARYARSWQNQLKNALDPLTKGMSKEDAAKTLTQLGRQIRSGTDVAGTAIGKAAAEIRSILKDVRQRAVSAGLEIGDAGRNYLPRVLNADKVLNDKAKFIKAAADAYRADNPELSLSDARDMAEAWHAKEMADALGYAPDATDFSRFMANATKGGEATKARVLSTKAEKIISDAGFYHENPADALNAYFDKISRAAAITERLGPESANWAKIKESILKDGGAAELGNAVDLASKMFGFRTQPGIGGRAVNFIRSMTALTYLTEAATLHVMQPLLAGVRTGRIGDSFRTYVTEFRALAGNAKDDVKLAETLGIIHNNLADLMSETLLTSSNIAGKVFEKTGLEPMLKAVSVGAFDSGMAFMRHLAGKDALDAADKRVLNSFGVPEKEHANFMKYVRDLDGKPDMSAFDGKYGDMLRLVGQRMVDQTIMRPNAALRPRWAEHPIGSLVYAITSYMQAFSTNAVERSLSMAKSAVKEGGLAAGERVKLLAPAMLLATTVLPATFALQNMRRNVLNANPDHPPHKPETAMDWALDIASESGMLGRWEAALNLYTSVKFDRDISTVLSGPVITGVGDVTRRAYGAAKHVANGEPVPVNDKRELADRTYRNLVYPGIMAAIVSSPAGALFTIPAAYTLRNPEVRHKLFVDPVTGTTANTQAGGRGERGGRNTRSANSRH